MNRESAIALVLKYVLDKDLREWARTQWTDATKPEEMPPRLLCWLAVSDAAAEGNRNIGDDVATAVEALVKTEDHAFSKSWEAYKTAKNAWKGADSWVLSKTGGDDSHMWQGTILTNTCNALRFVWNDLMNTAAKFGAASALCAVGVATTDEQFRLIAEAGYHRGWSAMAHKLMATIKIPGF